MVYCRDDKIELPFGSSRNYAGHFWAQEGWELAGSFGSGMYSDQGNVGAIAMPVSLQRLTLKDH
jgi:hypothetical protein